MSEVSNLNPSSFSNDHLEGVTFFKKEEFEVDWDKISDSSFSQVYKVKIKMWREKCALKTFSTSSDYRNMLQVAKLGKLKFKYLISVYGLCQNPPSAVMEFMNKGSLDSLLTTHVLMWPKKFLMIHEVTMGLNFLHSMKPPLLHLNLKLSNILFDDHLHVKLSDFGLIKWETSSGKMTFVEHLVARGNIAYIPPESFTQNPEPPSSKFDVYSFSIVMWEILTQTRPYSGMNTTEIVIKVSSGKRPSIERIPEDKPPECEEMIGIMQNCWQQDLLERPTFSEIIWMTEALSDVLKIPDLIPGKVTKKRLKNAEPVLTALKANSIDIPDENSDHSIRLYLKCKDFETFKNVLRKQHVSMTFKDGNSLLHYAAASGDTESVRQVLSLGGSVNCQSVGGYTPLVVALLKKFHDACALLVEYGADVNLPDKDQWTPLHFASQAGDDRGVRLLLNAKAAIEVKDKDGWTPLHLASQNGHENVVLLLLPRLNYVDEQEYKFTRTALHTACWYGHLRIAKLLLAKGADPNKADCSQATALHLAAQEGHFRIVRLLVTSGAEVRCKAKNDYSALHFAALRGCSGICRLLLTNGGDANVRTVQNWTPMHLAALKGHLETLLVLEEHGGLVDAPGEGGWTALHLACHHQHDEVVSALMSANANPDVAEDGGWTPLHLACHKGSFVNVLQLIAKNANVNAQNSSKDTPLHLAVQSCNAPIVKALLMNNVNKSIVNSSGHTALDLALQDCKTEIVQLLKD